MLQSSQTTIYKKSTAMKTILTQNKLILLSLTIIAAFAFTSCSDMVSPNGEDISDNLISQEYDNTFDFRGHANNRRQTGGEDGIGGEGGEAAQCGAQTVVLGAGSNADDIGNVAYAFNIFGDLVITINTHSNYIIDNVRVWIAKDLTDITQGNNLRQQDRLDIEFDTGSDTSVITIPRSVHGVRSSDNFNLVVSVSATQTTTGNGVTSYAGENVGMPGGNFWRYTTYTPCSSTSGSVL